MGYFNKAMLVASAALCFNLSTFAQDISLKISNVTVKEAMEQLKKTSGYSFVFSSNDINTKQRVSVSAEDATIEEVVKQILKGQNGIDYEIQGKKIILRKSNIQYSAPHKTIKVRGNVLDANGDPIIGATIKEKGTSNGTITDFDGNFSFDVSDKSIIEVSYIGYKPQELKAISEKELAVVLKEDTEMLDEVVVVGFGSQKKTNLTGAVSVVTADEIAERPVMNVSQALQGVVPGLNITQTNGSLEDNPSINVRGIGTIGQGSSGSPLILIDGMEGNINSINPQDIASISVLKDAAASSIYGSRAPFGVILITTKKGNDDGKLTLNYNNSFRFGNPINKNHMMNSVDFASFINDANTNSGSSVFFDNERMAKIVEYHNAKPYKPGQRITEDGRILYALSPSPWNETVWGDGYQVGIDDVDRFDIIYKDWTFSQEHNFSVDGGNKKFNYYASLNYLDQGGLMKIGEEGLKRYNVTAKINSEITDWLRFNYTIRYSRQDQKRPSRLTSGLYETIARQGWPTLPLYDPNGYYYSSPSPELGLAEGGTDWWQDDRLYQQAGLLIEPIKNWITHVEFNYATYQHDRHWDSQVLYNHDVAGNPIVYQEGSEVHEELYKTAHLTFNAYTEYTHMFNDIHNLHVMAGFQAEELRERRYGMTRYGIMFPNKPEIDLTSGNSYYGEEVTPYLYGNRNEWAIAGFFGRVNYNYLGRYLFEANLRTDGSSRFRSNNRWKSFPSVSVGWNIAQEKFFEPLSNTVGTLKLRGSFGSLGNQNTTNWYQTYQTLGIYSASGSWLLNGNRPNIASTPGLVSTELGWETIQTYNMGIDWSMLNNRLTGSFEYYIRDTKNMVGNAPELPNILGTGVPVTNNTDLRSKGWELTLGWRDRLQSGFSYGINVNLSDARTMITEYPNNATGNIWSYNPGRYIGEIWGYTTLGLAQTDKQMQDHLATLPNGGQDALGQDWAAGDVMYADINGDGKISSGSGTLSDHGDLSVIGNNTPRYLFGLDLNASWNGLDFRAFFQGVMKRDVWQGSAYMFGTSWQIWNDNGLTAVSDYFRDENTWSVQNGYQQANLDAYLPRPLHNYKNQQTQTRYLQNAAYVRLKNLQLGYTIPNDITSRWNVKNLRVFVSGENLWTLSGVDKQFDPETIYGGYSEGVAYPLSRTISFGLNITL